MKPVMNRFMFVVLAAGLLLISASAGFAGHHGASKEKKDRYPAGGVRFQ